MYLTRPYSFVNPHEGKDLADATPWTKSYMLTMASDLNSGCTSLSKSATHWLPYLYSTINLECCSGVEAAFPIELVGLKA